MKQILGGLFACAFALPVHATTITRTYDFVASDFYLLSSVVTPLALPPVTGSFTLTFDNSASFDAKTTGIVQNNLSIMNDVLQFSYFQPWDEIIIGSPDFLAAPNMFYLPIYNASGVPSAPFFQYRNVFIDPWPTAISVVVTAEGGSALPEPASWALMVGGLGAVGYAMRRRPKLSFRDKTAP